MCGFPLTQQPPVGMFSPEMYLRMFVQNEQCTRFFTVCDRSGVPRCIGVKEPTCQCRRHKEIPGPDPWIRKIPWRREWQPTPVFLHGESQGQRTLAGYSPWGHRESDTTERLTLSLHFQCVLALPHLTSFFSDLFGRLCASMKEILPAILVNNRCGSHQAIIFQRCQQ